MWDDANEVSKSGYECLKLDLSLSGADNATYELKDEYNNIYRPTKYDTISPGWQVISFVIPKDTLFKLITVTPTAGAPFNIKWWNTPRKSNGNIIMRYYGITDWSINGDQQDFTVQFRMANNGTSELSIDPQKFALVDQWGGVYRPVQGVAPSILKPNTSTSKINAKITGVPLSRKLTAVAYDYGMPAQIVIDLGIDQGQLSDEAAYR